MVGYSILLEVIGTNLLASLSRGPLLSEERVLVLNIHLVLLLPELLGATSGPRFASDTQCVPHLVASLQPEEHRLPGSTSSRAFKRGSSLGEVFRYETVQKCRNGIEHYMIMCWEGIPPTLHQDQWRQGYPNIASAFLTQDF